MLSCQMTTEFLPRNGEVNYLTRSCDLTPSILIQFVEEVEEPKMFIIRRSQQVGLGEVISRKDDMNWLPRSYDGTPLKFCVWGYVKSKNYR